MPDLNALILEELRALRRRVENLETIEYAGQAGNAGMVDGLHAATSGADAHVLATNGNGDAVVTGAWQRGGRYQFTITRNLSQAAVGNYTYIGSFAVGWGGYARLRVYGTTTNVVQVAEYAFWTTNYGAQTDWIALPFLAGMQFGGIGDFSVDIRQAAATDPVEVRLRTTITNGSETIALTIEVETNTAYTASTATGSGATVVAGYLAQPGFQFPVSASRLSNSIEGLFITPAGNVGIGVVDPTHKIEMAGDAQASNFISTVATGTAPYAGTSQTLNSNLNADLLDGKEASAFAGMYLPATVKNATDYQFTAGVEPNDYQNLADITQDVDVVDGDVVEAEFKADWYGTNIRNPAMAARISNGTTVSQIAVIGVPVASNWDTFVLFYRVAATGTATWTIHAEVYVYNAADTIHLKHCALRVKRIRAGG